MACDHRGVEHVEVLDIAAHGQRLQFRRREADDADGQTAAADHPVARHERRAAALVPQVRRHDRESHRRKQLPQVVRAVIEFMIAQRHRIRLHQFEQLELRASLGDRRNRRPLEIVARMQQQHVLLSRAFAVHIRLQHGIPADLGLLLFAIDSDIHRRRHVLRVQVIVMKYRQFDRLRLQRDGNKKQGECAGE